MSKSHLGALSAAFGGFAKESDISRLNQMNFCIIPIEAMGGGSTNIPENRRAKSKLQSWQYVGQLISGPRKQISERLCDWSSRPDVAAGLRWGDIPNPTPATTVLMEDGLIGFAEKP